MKVLLVDDEQKFITMLAKRLKFRGINPTVVTSGEDALKRSAEQSYDVAVLDIKMPGISGIELKYELAAIQKNLKFIFVTGHGCICNDEECFQSDEICLPKPLDIDTLIKTMKKIVPEI